MAATGSVNRAVMRQGAPNERRAVRSAHLSTRNSLRLISIVLMLVVWWIISLFVNKLFLPSPISVAKSFVTLTAHGGLLSATLDSLEIGRAHV